MQHHGQTRITSSFARIRNWSLAQMGSFQRGACRRVQSCIAQMAAAPQASRGRSAGAATSAPTAEALGPLDAHGGFEDLLFQAPAAPPLSRHVPVFVMVPRQDGRRADSHNKRMAELLLSLGHLQLLQERARAAGLPPWAPQERRSRTVLPYWHDFKREVAKDSHGAPRSTPASRACQRLGETGSDLGRQKKAQQDSNTYMV